MTALKGLGSCGVAAKAMSSVGMDVVDAAHASAIARFRQSDQGYRIGATFKVLPAKP